VGDGRERDPVCEDMPKPKCSHGPKPLLICVLAAQQQRRDRRAGQADGLGSNRAPITTARLAGPPTVWPPRSPQERPQCCRAPG
jgi:hypothetical protein